MCTLLSWDTVRGMVVLCELETDMDMEDPKQARRTSLVCRVASENPFSQEVAFVKSLEASLGFQWVKSCWNVWGWRGERGQDRNPQSE